MTHIIASPHPSPPLPRSSVFDYLFPPSNQKTEYYPKPDPDSVAFIDGLTGDEVTRGQIEEQAIRLASGLRGLGVKKGDVGMTFGSNSLQYINAIMGIQAAGAIVSPANAAYAPDELLHQLTDSTTSFIFIQPQLLPTLKAALEKAKSSGSKYTLSQDRIILLCSDSDKPADLPYKTIQQTWTDDTSRPKPLTSGEESDTAYLCYSSGTTGRAKGVETTHHNMTSQVQAVQMVMEPFIAGRDRVLGILPFSHIYGLTLLIHYPLVTGVPIIVLPRFDEIKVLEVIQKYKITFGYVVPPVLIVLLNSKNVPKYDISSLRGVMSGAAPLSADLAHAVQDKLKFGVTQGYGLTETSPVSHVMTVEESQGRKGRIGKLMPTYQARLVTEDGQDVVSQGKGERGELWLRGPSVMKGYWRNKDATKNTFAEGGWFMTGDVAEVDDQGYFAIVDRVKELIKYKGFQVPPAELEALLLTHPKVADAAVIAYPSPSQATELPRAYIVPKTPLDPALQDQEKFKSEITKWIEGKVANHKRLRGGVVLIEAIPKSPSGKILRKDLRAMTKKEIEDKIKSGREAKL